MTVIDQFHNASLAILSLMKALKRFLFSVLLIVTSSVFANGIAPAAITFKSLNDLDATSSTAIQGGMLIGTTSAKNKIWLDDKSVPVAKDGRFILGFGRDAKSSVLKVETEKGISHQQTINVEKREYKIERVDGLPPSRVNPVGEEVLRRIRKESALVKSARDRNDKRQDFINGFIWPAKGRISGVYGSQRVLNGKPKRPHFGIDIAAPKGSDVIAPAAGIVTLAESDLYYSGGTVIIDHGFGLSSTFLHLSKVLVKVGQRIEQTDLIAEIGATGRATGPHLDWRMNWFGVRLDAGLLVKHLSMTDGGSKIKIKEKVTKKE